MSNAIPDNVSFDEFLVAVNARDLNGSYVVPASDVVARLTQEIERKTGLKSSILSGESVAKTEKWLSAKPGEFITQTRIAIDNACALLLREKAKNFDLAFHNIPDRLNQWGDKILIAIRYQQAV